MPRAAWCGDSGSHARAPHDADSSALPVTRTRPLVCPSVYFSSFFTSVFLSFFPSFRPLSSLLFPWIVGFSSCPMSRWGSDLFDGSAATTHFLFTLTHSSLSLSLSFSLNSLSTTYDFLKRTAKLNLLRPCLLSDYLKVIRCKGPEETCSSESSI